MAQGGITAAGNPCGDLLLLAAHALVGPAQRLTAQTDWAAGAESRKTPHDPCLVVWCGCNALLSPGRLGIAGSGGGAGQWDVVALQAARRGSVRRLRQPGLPGRASPQAAGVWCLVFSPRNSFHGPAQASNEPSPPALGR